MKTTILILVLLSAFAVAQADEVTFTAGDVTMSIEISGVQSDGTTSTGSIIDAIADKLDTLEKDYVSQLKRLEQERAKKIIAEIFALLVQLPEDGTVTLNTSSSSSSSSQSTTVSMDVNVSGWDTEVEEPPAQEVVTGPQPMSAGDFARLKSDVQSEDFGDDMLGVVETAAMRNYFTTDQCRQLVQLFDFSDEQVQVVRIVWPKVVDPENGHQLLSAFTYSDDKEAVRGIINQ